MTQASPWKGLLLFMVLLFLACSVCENARAEDEPIENKGILLEEGVDYPMPAPGTDQSRKTGRIDSLDLENQVIIIDEASYNFLPTTAYYTSVMGKGSVHLFAQGQAVGYISNRKGELLSIWLME
jgi:hypothetical protein